MSGGLVMVETGRRHWGQVGRGWGCCSAPYRVRNGPATKNYPPRINDAQADKPRLGDEGAERNRMHFKFLGATFEKGKETGEINFDTVLCLNPTSPISYCFNRQSVIPV